MKDVKMPETISRRRDRRLFFILPGVFVAVLLFTFLTSKFKMSNENANAANLANFDPGYIISDFQMGNYSSMTEAEIQAFLVSKNSCDNTDVNLYNEMTAAYSPNYTWHFDNGHFVCLAEELFGDGEVIGSGETAAHIIWQTAQDYKINPQVLIVLLQKEQGLITDTYPNSRQYRVATGYGCPDTAPCSEKYYGFKNQIRKAAELFRTVLDGGWTNYLLGNNYVQYNPDKGCGGSIVNIKNLATSALYRYTPYQPNEGALAVGYGTTAVCGAYGNRNFYLYFEDWFGGIKDELPKIQMILNAMERVPDEETSVKFVDNVFVQKYGWLDTAIGGKMVGTTGNALGIEGIAMQLNNALGIEYRTYTRSTGWEEVYKKDGEISGTPGMGLMVEAFQMRLYGDLALKYDVYYRAHIQDYGWVDWAKNDAVIGMVGLSKKIEAIQVKIIEKPLFADIEYKAHVEDYGWMDTVASGELAGTTGQAKRAEAIIINKIGTLAGRLSCRAHVQDYGWMDAVTDGEIVGTTGQAKRVEAITIELTDDLAKYYDVFYRAHVQDYGWMDWVKNGEIAGTTGQAKRMEAVEIKLVAK